MVAMSSGLIITPQLFMRQVTSVSMTFEPSVGIMARKFRKLGHDVQDFREPLERAIEDVIIPSIQMNFHKHGRPSWAPLAQNTIEQRGGDARILNRTGALKEGMKSLDLWTITTDTAMITDLPGDIWYGKVHQAGMGSYEGFVDEVKGEVVNLGDDGAIPARPFIMIQPEDEDAIEQVFLDWLDECIVQAGLG